VQAKSRFRYRRSEPERPHPSKYQQLETIDLLFGVDPPRIRHRPGKRARAARTACAVTLSSAAATARKSDALFTDNILK